jgi:hypothetical protein
MLDFDTLLITALIKSGVGLGGQGKNLKIYMV